MVILYFKCADALMICLDWVFINKYIFGDPSLFFYNNLHLNAEFSHIWN